MLAELVVTGNELVDGRIVDTNSPWLLARLCEWGAQPKWVTLVGDDALTLEQAIDQACRRSELVVVSGGLGPTSDDLTAACAAKVARVGLSTHGPTLVRIHERYAQRGRTATPAIARQAEIPDGAEVLPNDEGTAPAFRLRIGAADAFFFAGVPREFKHLADTHLRPFVEARRLRSRASRTLRCFGVPESELDALLLPVAGARALELGLRAAWPEAWAILSGESTDAAELASRLDAAVAEGVAHLAGRCFSFDGKSLPEVIASLAHSIGARVATAESCTGGLAGAALTDVPGSSAWYVGGVVSYSNVLKATLLGVPPDLLAEHGAVSEPVVRAMAEGATTALGATHAIAITGVAGPSGGTPDKPVGTVWIAVAAPSGTRSQLVSSVRQDRSSVRELAVGAALDLLRRVLAGAA